MRFLKDGYVSGESYRTENAGVKWLTDTNFLNVNRFRLVHKNIYAVGKNFYKIQSP